MNALRGLGRGSHVTGKSVHNQRIERLWVDVYTQVVDYFYREFYTLEEQGILNPEKDTHMFALHKVYVKSINEKLSYFQKAWNSHTIRTTRKSPRQMWISGMLENMNSGHTATEEVFRPNEDLYTRTIQAFETYDINVNVLNINEDISSNMTYELPLSENVVVEIERILHEPTEDKEKYLHIISII